MAMVQKVCGGIGDSDGWADSDSAGFECDDADDDEIGDGAGVRGANGRVSQHTIDVAIGVNLESQKELLGLWLAENEGAEFWRHVLTDLKNRGLKDIFVAGHRPQVGRDGLTGFSEAIKTVSERTKVQLCVVHLVRAAMRDVVDKDCRPVAADLKKIDNAEAVNVSWSTFSTCSKSLEFGTLKTCPTRFVHKLAATLVEAEQALENFAQAADKNHREKNHRDEKSPTISKTWRTKWTDIITLFDFAVVPSAR